MGEKKFYDIHCHAMNLSHPNFLAFLRRLETGVRNRRALLFISLNLGFMAYFLFSILPSALSSRMMEKTGLSRRVGRLQNLLALMENDLGSFFTLVNDSIVENILIDGRLQIGENSYDKIVLTPLVMDFGYKNMVNPALSYHRRPVQKPVVEQVIDLFNGIRNYLQNGSSKQKIFEIYPFLGLNTANYSLEKIETMLEKYFRDYRARSADFYVNLGKFSGNIEEMGGNYFSGVKVYPPLGFDPWPKEREARKKVECLYEYCSLKRIPVTTHCSDGGFRTVDLADALEYTSPARWSQVLSRYPGLKLNFAHMGNTGRSTGWNRMIVDLIERYENVYTDFSCRGLNESFYLCLGRNINRMPPVSREKLFRRILFGSDFMINLFWMDSYCHYLKVFFDTKSFSSGEKELFSRSNPEAFLWENNLIQ